MAISFYLSICLCVAIAGVTAQPFTPAQCAPKARYIRYTRDNVGGVFALDEVQVLHQGKNVVTSGITPLRASSSNVLGGDTLRYGAANVINGRIGSGGVWQPDVLTDPASLTLTFASPVMMDSIALVLNKFTTDVSYEIILDSPSCSNRLARTRITAENGTTIMWRLPSARRVNRVTIARDSNIAFPNIQVWGYKTNTLSSVMLAPGPGVSASASSELSHAKDSGFYSASKAIDASSNTFWHSGPSDPNPSITIDLGMEYPIHRIIALSREDCCATRPLGGKFELLTSRNMLITSLPVSSRNYRVTGRVASCPIGFNDEMKGFWQLPVPTRCPSPSVTPSRSPSPSRTASRTSSKTVSATASQSQSPSQSASTTPSATASASVLLTQFFPLPSGSSNGLLGDNGNVNAITTVGTDLYIGGRFVKLGDESTANRIVKWNTVSSSWTVLPSGASNGVSGEVSGITAIGTDVYIVGNFATLADGTTVNRIVKWDTVSSSWTAFPVGNGIGIDDHAWVITAVGTDLYIGGRFTALDDGSSANRIVKLNTVSLAWSVLPSGTSNGLDSPVNAITAVGTDLYIGGVFTNLGDGTTSANRIVKWNTVSSTWTVLPSGTSNGLDSGVNAITAVGTDLYIGGGFTKLGDGTSANYIVKWNTVSSTWTVLPSGTSNGLSSTVRALAAIGTDLYMGGSFLQLGDGTSAKRIVEWDTVSSTWTVLPSGSSDGLDGAVRALAVTGNHLYIGGGFVNLGDGTTSANRIVKWVKV